MFLARDKKRSFNQRVREWSKETSLLLSSLRNECSLEKKEKNVRTHFAHESLKSCDFYHENEGPEHLENKVALFNWVKKNAEVEMEYPIPELKQIADILINKQI